MIFDMKRQIFLRALTLGLCASALVFTGCATPEQRISDNPQIYQSLSPRDQELVKVGKIREGMKPVKKINFSGSKPTFCFASALSNGLKTSVSKVFGIL